MSVPFNVEQLSQLKAFIQMCKTMPQILHHPSLDFFKEFIITMGGAIPEAASRPEPPPAEPQAPKTENQPMPDAAESDGESEVELDMEGVIQGDSIDDDQVMGDPSKESTEEEIDQSDEKRTAAMRHFSEQEFEDAVKLYTEAILLNPTSALLFAKRGQVYLKLNKPNACIKDCTHALQLNCDSAASYKFRGRANRLLGNFEQAAADLRESCKIDYDDQVQEWLTEVTPNADKIRAHSLNVQRRKEEKDRKEKLKRYQEAKAAHATAAQAKTSEGIPNPEPEFGQGFGDNAPGGAPFNMADSMGFFNDPELMTAFQDPEVAAAFKDVTENPANIFKHQNNPKVANILNKLSSKFGGGQGGFPGFTAPPSGAPPSTDDVGLD